MSDLDLQYIGTVTSKEGSPIEGWHILVDSEIVGNIKVWRSLKTPEVLYVEDIYVKSEHRNRIGPRGVRSILRLLQQEYPEVTDVAGHRISGARGFLGSIDNAPYIRTRIT